MKAEVNNENKAKFFAQYWGQELCNDIGCGLRYETFEEVNSLTSLEDSYLELKSLSDISDEDAIMCYDILYPGTKWPDDYKIKEIKSWFNDEYGIATIKHKWAVGNVFDFLRSRGYLVPWMGLSFEEMIEAGWVKYK